MRKAPSREKPIKRVKKQELYVEVIVEIDEGMEKKIWKYQFSL